MFYRRLSRTEGDIIFDGIRKQKDVLAHRSHHRPDLTAVQVVSIFLSKQDLSAAGPQITIQTINQGRFSGAYFTRKRSPAPGNLKEMFEARPSPL